MNGLLIIDKPAGMTSHDVVSRIRRITQERSVGHLGTLDPMATGVLPLLLGKFTRLAQFFADADKTYEGCIRFGCATDTFDAEGTVLSAPSPVNCSESELEDAMQRFRGRIEQTPPAYSAKKILGTPAYKLARKNVEVNLKPVSVEVHEFARLDFDPGLATMKFRARVSSGTYIRSLAHDLGQALGCGAHLSALCRTQSGEFSIENAISLEKLMSGEQLASDHLVHARNFLRELSPVTADESQLFKIRHGNAVNLPEFSAAPLVKVFANRDELACIAARLAGTLFQPRVVLLEQ